MVEQYPGLTGDLLARMMRLVGQDIGDSARWRHNGLRHPPHASSGWSEPPLGVHLKDLCSELSDALAGFCGAGDGDAVAELQ